jgi:hypothetical protein
MKKPRPLRFRATIILALGLCLSIRAALTDLAQDAA